MGADGLTSYQAAVSHSFGLSEKKALQSVTSVAAQSIQQDHRIGFVRPGYDADLAIWDSHPLSVGATTVQVFVDGREVLDAGDALEKLETSARPTDLSVPKTRPTIQQEKRQDICGKAVAPGSKIAFTGIKSVLIQKPVPSIGTNSVDENSLVMLVSNGEISCLDVESKCLAPHIQGSILKIHLENGYVTPGLVAFGNNIGIVDIPSEPSTGDGSSGGKSNALNQQKDLHFAKYGVHFGGRGFGRARVGGVTKAITTPISGGGALQGVSVGLRTNENATILGGGIWKNDVALHFAVGQEAKGKLQFNQYK